MPTGGRAQLKVPILDGDGNVVNMVLNDVYNVNDRIWGTSFDSVDAETGLDWHHDLIMLAILHPIWAALRIRNRNETVGDELTLASDGTFDFGTMA